MSSWYLTKMYQVKINRAILIIKNEYQRLDCPHCNKDLFGRMTTSWHNQANGPPILNEYHYNNSDSPNQFDNMPIIYLDIKQDDALFAFDHEVFRVKKEVLSENIQGRWPLIELEEIRLFGSLVGTECQ